MKVRVRYFASLREALGAQEEVDLPAGSSLGALREQLMAQSPRHAAALNRGRALRGAVNQVMAEDGTALTDGAEVAFFPPVTGG